MKQKHINNPTNHTTTNVTPEVGKSLLKVVTPSEMKELTQPLQDKDLKALEEQANKAADSYVRKLQSELLKGKPSAAVGLNCGDNIKGEVVRLILMAFATAGWHVNYSSYDNEITVRYPRLGESEE